jgi:hypothetical protein
VGAVLVDYYQPLLEEFLVGNQNLSRNSNSIVLEGSSQIANNFLPDNLKVLVNANNGALLL